jgi:hypothetical protein
MRKEKRGHVRGTDDRGRAGACGRLRHDGDAMGQRGQWKSKRDGRLYGKRGLCNVGMTENRGVGFGSSSGGKGFKKNFKQVIGNAI